MDLNLKSYKKDYDYSYSFGAFPTIELLKTKPDNIVKVLVSINFKENSPASSIYDICKSKDIEIQVNDKVFNRLSPKENCYVIGVFKKYKTFLEPSSNHIVLVNPSNMGNLGTIIRTLVGFGIYNLVIISLGVDIYDPKVIRASMGSIFKINFQYYDSFELYMNNFKKHQIFTFMLNGKETLQDMKIDKDCVFSLVLGNEASGLGDEFLYYGTSVVIRHSNEIDSLNLPVSVSIAAYEFTR